MIKVGINGFGRIGRNAFRAAWGRKDVEIVAVNDLTDTATLAHLLKYDSVFGVWGQEVSHEKDFIVVGGKKIHATAIAKLEEQKWGEFGCDIVIESTGRFTDAHQAIHGSVPQEDPMKVYFLERRRALLAEVAAIERLLGFEKKTVDKR